MKTPEQAAGAVKVVSYRAHDGQEVNLTIDICRNFLVSGKAELVTIPEFVFYMGVCKSRGLNPFAGDCYLVKFTPNQKAATIVSRGHYQTRAKQQEDCKGWKSGIIVRTADGFEEREGHFILPEEELLGGWFEATPEGWTVSKRVTVPLSGYIKRTKSGDITQFWIPEKQPMMIEKVAEVQGLRTIWSKEFANLHVAEEIVDSIQPDEAADGVVSASEAMENLGKATETDKEEPSGPTAAELNPDLKKQAEDFRKAEREQGDIPEDEIPTVDEKTDDELIEERYVDEKGTDVTGKVEALEPTPPDLAADHAKLAESLRQMKSTERVEWVRANIKHIADGSLQVLQGVKDVIESTIKGAKTTGAKELAQIMAEPHFHALPDSWRVALYNKIQSLTKKKYDPKYPMHGFADEAKEDDPKGTALRCPDPARKEEMMYTSFCSSGNCHLSDKCGPFQEFLHASNGAGGEPAGGKF